MAGIVGFGIMIVMSRSGGSAGLLPKRSPIKGAVYASAIPVYSGAKLEDVMGGNYYDQIGGPVTFTSNSWFFTVKAPMEKVIAFYRTKMPQGTTLEEAEEGSTAFKWIPPGAVEGEDVTVTIREGEIQIGETVKAKGQ
jgi:hypothetical protein